MEGNDAPIAAITMSKNLNKNISIAYGNEPEDIKEFDDDLIVIGTQYEDFSNDTCCGFLECFAPENMKMKNIGIRNGQPEAIKLSPSGHLYYTSTPNENSPDHLKKDLPSLTIYPKFD